MVKKAIEWTVVVLIPVIYGWFVVWSENFNEGEHDNKNKMLIRILEWVVVILIPAAYGWWLWRIIR